jgi:hypothetical protein
VIKITENVQILLEDTKTGETQWVDSGYAIGDDGIYFQWQENNYSCDCNRELFFYRARGKEPENEACGETRFAIKATKPDIGLTDEGR